LNFIEENVRPFCHSHLSYARPFGD
jgi:hypothetical protein